MIESMVRAFVARSAVAVAVHSFHGFVSWFTSVCCLFQMLYSSSMFECSPEACLFQCLFDVRCSCILLCVGVRPVCPSSSFSDHESYLGSLLRWLLPRLGLAMRWLNTAGCATHHRSMIQATHAYAHAHAHTHQTAINYIASQFSWLPARRGSSAMQLTLAVSW